MAKALFQLFLSVIVVPGAFVYWYLSPEGELSGAASVEQATVASQPLEDRSDTATTEESALIPQSIEVIEPDSDGTSEEEQTVKAQPVKSESSPILPQTAEPVHLLEGEVLASQPAENTSPLSETETQFVQTATTPIEGDAVVANMDELTSETGSLLDKILDSNNPLGQCVKSVQKVACPLINKIPVLNSVVGKIQVKFGLSCPGGEDDLQTVSLPDSIEAEAFENRLLLAAD